MNKPIIGSSLHSDQISLYREILFQLPAMEIENFLFPGFSDSESLCDGKVKDTLADYHGKIMVSAPYIDLNPGSPERLVIDACKTRFRQVNRFAMELGATEIIFLSTFLPFVYLKGYEEDWRERSSSFWKTFMEEVDPCMTISLCNTFEFHPAYLCQIAQDVDRPNFKLALDVGHFLVYARIHFEEWLKDIQPYCGTVYMHSNLGDKDTHDEPYRGKLTQDMVRKVFTEFNPRTVWLVKSNSKENLLTSIEWLEKSVTG